jgi:hypothetical protein
MAASVIGSSASLAKLRTSSINALGLPSRTDWTSGRGRAVVDREYISLGHTRWKFLKRWIFRSARARVDRKIQPPRASA